MKTLTTKPKDPTLLYGEIPQHHAVDDRLYEDIDENFEPTFFSKRKEPKKTVDESNPSLIRKSSNNKFLRKEQRSLESLRKSWEEELKTEEEKLAPLVTDVIKVPKKVHAQFISDLSANMASIEAFMLKEVAPVEVALIDSLERARQTISIITDSEVEADSINATLSLFREAVRLKTFDFLCAKLQLPERLRKVLIEKHFGHEQIRGRP